MLSIYQPSFRSQLLCWSSTFFEAPVIVPKPPVQTTLPEHELQEPDKLSPAAYVEELDAMSNGSDTEYQPENEV